MAQREKQGEAKVTEAAQRKAEETEVDIEKVEATGSDGSVTAADVEEQAPEIRAEENEAFRVRINPALGPNVDGVDVGGTFYKEGTTVTAGEFEGLRSAKIGGHQALLKGAKVG